MARRKVTPDEQKKWFELYQDGMNTTAIAKEAGRPPRTVRENIQKMLKDNPDVKRASKPKTPAPAAPKKKRGPKPKDKPLYKGIRQVVFLPEGTHRLLKVAAAIRRTGASEIVNEALLKHLKDLAKQMPLFFGENE